VSFTEIAFDVGFSGPAAFARAFKARFGMSASEWRNGGGASKLGKANRNWGELLPWVEDQRGAVGARSSCCPLLSKHRGCLSSHHGP
jgi:hypothetical protein